MFEAVFEAGISIYIGNRCLYFSNSHISNLYILEFFEFFLMFKEAISTCMELVPDKFSGEKRREHKFLI